MAQIVHQTEKEIWIFASKQLGFVKALKNMMDDENAVLEETVKFTVEEAKGLLPEGAKIIDIQVETQSFNGSIVNVLVKADIGK